MKIKRLVIENFKSIERIELLEPNPFTVFVGPNGSGKSNIFEALEFVNRCSKTSINEAFRVFGGTKKIQNRTGNPKELFLFSTQFKENPYSTQMSFEFGPNRPIQKGPTVNVPDSKRYSGVFTLTTPDALEQFYLRFSRLFINKSELLKFNYPDEVSLDLAATNLELVLKRILGDQTLRAEIFEWLELFVPGFRAIEVDDRNELHWFEQSTVEYFTKDLISDGTYNILAILTAVYQSNEPQFLCIEEPENGLHPQVLMTLVDFFRKQCEEKGHYIWLNTHSESLVRCLTTDEIVLVNKLNGATQIRQIKGKNLYDIPTDEAWLTGALGGGLPW